MKLLFFADSTCLQSCKRRVAHVAAAMARDAGADVSPIDLADFDILLYDADLENRGTPPDVLRLKQQWFDHPARIILSPKYNDSYPALLKNTLDCASSALTRHPDWIDGTRPMPGNVGGLLSASPSALGGLHSLSHLTPLLLNLQCWVAPGTYALGHADQAVDAQGQLTRVGPRNGMLRVVSQTPVCRTVAPSGMNSQIPTPSAPRPWSTTALDRGRFKTRVYRGALKCWPRRFAQHAFLAASQGVGNFRMWHRQTSSLGMGRLQPFAVTTTKRCR
jgi:NAD(P)H-dependent FMN reductase